MEYSYVTLRYVTLRYVTLRYVTLRYVTLRYVTLRYVTNIFLLCFSFPSGLLIVSLLESFGQFVIIIVSSAR